MIQLSLNFPCIYRCINLFYNLIDRHNEYYLCRILFKRRGHFCLGKQLIINLNEMHESCNLNGGRIYGVCTPLYKGVAQFWFLTSFSRCKKDFLPVLSKSSQASMVRTFHFSDEWKVVSVAPQREVYISPVNVEVFFIYIGHGK